MDYTITNVVYTASTGSPINLTGPPLIELSNYISPQSTKRRSSRKPKKKNFPGGNLKFDSGTVLVFANGKVVIHAKTTKYLSDCKHQFEAVIGQKLSPPVMQSMAAKLDIKCSVDLAYFAFLSGAEYEPELHPGLMLKFSNVCVILYHTGVAIVTGCRSLKDFFIIVRKTGNLINNYTKNLKYRDEFYRNHYWKNI